MRELEFDLRIIRELRRGQRLAGEKRRSDGVGCEVLLQQFNDRRAVTLALHKQANHLIGTMGRRPVGELHAIAAGRQCRQGESRADGEGSPDL